MDVVSGCEDLFCVEPMSLASSSRQRESPSRTTRTSRRRRRELGESGEVIRNSQNRLPDSEVEDDIVENLVALTNDVEGSDNEEQDAASGFALDVRNGGEAENLMDARNSVVGMIEAARSAAEAESNAGYLIVESESDSDQSNQDGGQRSVQTGATVGSDYDGSGESTQQEDEDSETAETDDLEAEEVIMNDEQLEIRPSHRTNLAPQSMQWVVRSRDNISRSSGGFRFTSGGNSLVFIVPSSLPRTGTGGSSTGTTTTVAATVEPPVTMSTTAACLTRAFAIVIRQIADLFRTLQDYNTMAPPLATVSSVTQQDVDNLQIIFRSKTHHQKRSYQCIKCIQ
ncbi:E3 ubiquitin-protein ligase hyd-like isoform X2 [Planococcus citri]|uniref:E3 ubiquitin-protein ligase hyd-like isoform X2 n=1 Tax=Planococcus citri TaxID=170843 RepID=UPI0031F74BAD